MKRCRVLVEAMCRAQEAMTTAAKFAQGAANAFRDLNDYMLHMCVCLMCSYCSYTIVDCLTLCARTSTTNCSDPSTL